MGGTRRDAVGPVTGSAPRHAMGSGSHAVGPAPPRAGRKIRALHEYAPHLTSHGFIDAPPKGAPGLLHAHRVPGVGRHRSGTEVGRLRCHCVAMDKPVLPGALDAFFNGIEMHQIRDLSETDSPAIWLGGASRTAVSDGRFKALCGALVNRRSFVDGLYLQGERAR